MILQDLPISEVLPELIQQLKSHSSVILRAPTGAGKTTRVPPALLDAGFATRQRIVMLEPRRIAARAAARRMAQERGTPLGEEVGFQVRFERKFSRSTKILVVTPGILLRMIQDDPYLESISVLIFDEFHERGLESDLALGMARLMQQTVREDLRLLVMSATLDTEKLKGYLAEAPVVTSEGRLFPVEIRYQPPPRELDLPLATARAIENLLPQTTGDVLVFLPGVGEIRQTMAELQSLAQENDLALLPLYGDLPSEQQDAALLRQNRRKIVLATNVAETSVTVEGITGVIDTGLARVLQFDPGVGLDRLQLEGISQSSADQRSGRAGRLHPGICVRLWSEISHQSRLMQTKPEIERVDLTGAVLHLLAMGETEVLNFPWLDPPSVGSVQQSLDLLRLLGAVDETGITDEGRELARLPVHPRIGKLLRAGQGSAQVALAAAILSERDIFLRSMGGSSSASQTFSDLLERLEILEEYERTRRTQFPLGTINPGTARAILQVRNQLLRESDDSSKREADHEEVLRSLLAAFPDRVIRRRERGSLKGVMVGGRGVRLAPSSGVIEPEFFLGLIVDAGGTESLVRLASGVERGWLPANQVKTQVEVEFDSEFQKVVAFRRSRYQDLLLDETSAMLPKGEEAARVLLAAAFRDLDQIFPPDDEVAESFLGRVRFLHRWMPELVLPAFDATDLHEILTWFAPHYKSFADLRKANWLQAMKGKLSYSQQKALDQEAPEQIEVPSGSQIFLQYQTGVPILAVRIQELFGLSETPPIAAGRVKVLLHLLAPNSRPQQVTDDLASFWVNTYPIVRKELRVKYPKHSWPEDPLTAEPLRGVKKRHN